MAGGYDINALMRNVPKVPESPATTAAAPVALNPIPAASPAAPAQPYTRPNPVGMNPEQFNDTVRSSGFVAAPPDGPRPVVAATPAQTPQADVTKFQPPTLPGASNTTAPTPGPAPAGAGAQPDAAKFDPPKLPTAPNPAPPATSNPADDELKRQRSASAF